LSALTAPEAGQVKGSGQQSDAFRISGETAAQDSRAYVGFKDKVDTIVYTMGKVGSSSVSASLNAAGLKCLDAHFVAPARVVKVLHKYFESPEIETLPPHIFDSLLAHNAIVKQGKIRIISLIRNPVMRNISAVFQNTPLDLLGDFDAIMARLQKYPTRTPDIWFETDFGVTTGIDVFNLEIDPAADHFRFANDKFDVLLMKLEADDERKARLISDFVGKKISLVRANEAAKKLYYEIYQKITRNPNCIRSSYIEECSGLKYFQKFYSEAEREELTGRFA